MNQLLTVILIFLAPLASYGSDGATVDAFFLSLARPASDKKLGHDWIAKSAVEIPGGKLNAKIDFTSLSASVWAVYISELAGEWTGNSIFVRNASDGIYVIDRHLFFDGIAPTPNTQFKASVSTPAPGVLFLAINNEDFSTTYRFTSAKDRDGRDSLVRIEFEMNSSAHGHRSLAISDIYRTW